MFLYIYMCFNFKWPLYNKKENLIIIESICIEYFYNYDEKQFVVICSLVNVLNLEIKDPYNYQNCFNKIRLELEKDNLIPVCNGCRVDCHSTGMDLSMGEGLVLTIWKIGQKPKMSDKVYLFDETKIDLIGYIYEQEAYYENWLNWLKEQ